MAVKLEGLLWISSLVFRFLWVLYPQTGYIHPDEFFQSPEIVAGDVFGFQTLRTWEFNATLPIRSILLPYIVTGLPFAILHKLHTVTMLPLNTWVLAVAPRLVLCCLSTVIDVCAYKISCLLQVDPASVLAVIGTSYVTLVFHTRPFSNTLESVLFALLLLVLANHVLSKDRTKVKLNNMAVGIVIVAGVWNRPTFLAYASIPSLTWCYRFFQDSPLSWTSITTLIKEACLIIIGAVLTMVLFIAVDSMYFGNVTITPLNFIKYNLDTSHLKEHGIHPRFTHFIVNMPLLFGVLAVLFYCHIIIIGFSREFTDNTNMLNLPAKNSGTQNIKENASPTSMMFFYKVLTLSVVAPVGLLSVIPHQEARFLTPILTPLAILFAHIIIGPRHFSMAAASWLLWNLIGCVLFGVLHQGGMYSCLQYLQGHLSPLPLEGRPTTYHVVFANTYMPPRHLLAWQDCSGKDCTTRNSLVVHDLGGQTRQELSTWLDNLVKNSIDNNKRHQVIKHQLLW